MKKILITFTAILLIGITTAISQSIQSPSEFLGYELGSRFTRHYLVVDYFKSIANSSKNLKLVKYGETNEFRPLYVSFISSEENIKNLENIRIDNLKRTGIVNGNSNSKIAIVWLSYNVHGNEASGAEAAMLTMYNLITQKQDWLKNTVVIIDPCVNPDGRDRYVNWYSEHKSTPFNTNPDVMEHNEPWPGGRPNHYLFDLNRDWAWASQVETQQRLKVYNKWMPNVHVDFHEQGHNSPYYFAPAAEPFHEVITDWQRDFQIQIGKNHARYFDKNGWRYFTKERFDLLYPSYGDTYPTYMGAVSMTYEQAGNGRAGLGIETENEEVLTLKERLTHHTTTGLSTVEISSKNSDKLLLEFKKFFNNENLPYKSYLLRGSSEKINHVIEFLNKHDITSYFAEERMLKSYDYQSKSVRTLKTTSHDLVIPTNQPKGKMVKVLFEQETKLSTPLTYDITAWSIPYAYGLQGFASKYEVLATKNTVSKPAIVNTVHKNAYAYISKWNEVSDTKFLGSLLEEGFNVRSSGKAFSVEGKQFNRGSLLILRGENKHINGFDETVIEIANRAKQQLTDVNTGFVSTGKDFGSSSYRLIKSRKIAVLAGEGTSSLSFGEIWHFFETQLNYPLQVINLNDFENTNFSDYDVLILPNGYESTEDELKLLTSFANNGGTIVAIGSSLSSFSDKEGYALKTKKDDDDDDDEASEEKKSENLIPYDKRQEAALKNAITGSIFKSTIDNSHPLAFGYSNTYYSLKLSSKAYELLDKGYNVGYFPENTTNTAGYSGSDALKKVPNSLLFGIERKGRGSVIYIVDNVLFRSFWEHGKLFFVNAVFLN